MDTLKEVAGPGQYPLQENWLLRRQDDAGNVFEIARNLTKEAAEKLRAEFEARGHKQMYWIEKQ